MRHLAIALVCGLVAAGTVGCGKPIDLGKSLQVTDVFTGWYDYGVVNELNKLVPSVSFRLRNTGSAPLNEVDLTVSFWQEGADGEWDSKEIAAIGRKSVLPGQSTDTILVRSDVGYTLAQPRAEMFSNQAFKDASVKLFGRRGGKIVPLGVFKIDRQIIPHTP